MNSNSNQNPFSNLTTNQKWVAGIIAAVVIMCGVFGIGAATFQMGRMSAARGNQQGYMMGAPAAPIAPDAPQAPNQQYQNDRPMGPQFNQQGQQGRRMSGRMGGGGFSFFGIIGGFFRLIFTILLIGFLIMVVRRFVFGRRGWGPWAWRGGPGGPGGWQHEHGVPPHIQEWHRRMHEQAAATATNADAPTATAADAPAATAAPPTTAPTEPTPPTDDTKLV